MLACPNDGCELAVIPADYLLSHQAVCLFETVKCAFGGGKCNGTYKRGAGSGEHYLEATQAHLNIAMGLIDALARENEAQARTNEAQMRTNKAQMRINEAQARTNEAQARTIKQLEERTNEMRTAKLHLKGIASANTPVTSLVSDTIWFCGNQVKLTLEKKTDDKTFVFFFPFWPRRIVDVPTDRHFLQGAEGGVAYKHGISTSVRGKWFGIMARPQPLGGGCSNGRGYQSWQRRVRHYSPLNHSRCLRGRSFHVIKQVTELHNMATFRLHLRPT
jgi:hypothetical protein